MGDLTDTVKQVGNPLSKPNKKRFKGVANPLYGDAKDSYALNPLRAAEDSVDDLGKAFTPEIPIPEEDTIIPIPDESSAKLAARRKKAKQNSGRDSTILTEGLGG